MPRRRLGDMPLWEQRIKNAASNGRQGWSARGNRGRVLIELRRPGELKQSVMLPKELSWCEGDEREITKWLDALYVKAEGEKLSLKAALERVKPTSNRVGHEHAVSWQEIKEAYRIRLMQSGNKIRLKTWADNYERFIDAALEILSKQRPSDGAALLRQTAQQWADHYSSRAMCVSTLKGFMEFAVRDNRFRAPQSWLIDEYDAKPIRGEKPQKQETAALADEEILKLLVATEERWDEGWRNVISTLVAFGLRPFELQMIEVRTNGDGQPQMYSTYRKSGGASKTRPRWLEEIPLTASDGSRVDLNITEQWKTMAWPQTRDGGRRIVTAHYIEQYLKKVPYWNELRRDYAEEMDLKVVPYSFRNSWNTRAKALGIPDGVVSRAFGNTEATNLRSYRQSTDQLTRNAFRDALGR